MRSRSTARLGRALSLALGALLLLSIPAARAQATATATDPAQEAALAPLVDVWGDGPARTGTFSLPDGLVTASWTANVPGDTTGACVVRAVLYRAAGDQFVWQLIGEILGPNVGRIAMGETQVYGVNAGLHYIEVLPTACSWSVRIRPS